jgi:hypothetical protein
VALAYMCVFFGPFLIFILPMLRPLFQTGEMIQGHVESGVEVAYVGMMDMD